LIWVARPGDFDLQSFGGVPPPPRHGLLASLLQGGSQLSEKAAAVEKLFFPARDFGSPAGELGIRFSPRPWVLSR